MKTEVKIQVRAYPVELKDHRTGETSTDVIVLSKEMLQAAGMIGITNEDLIYRTYNRKGYKVLEIGTVQKQEIVVDLHQLYFDKNAISLGNLVTKQEANARDAE